MNTYELGDKTGLWLKKPVRAKTKYMHKSAAGSLPRVDKNAAIELVTEFMAIPGKSCQEGQIVQRIRAALDQAGIPASAISTDAVHRKSPAGGEVGNLIVRLPGTVRGDRRMLMAHVDTVPLCVGSKPVRRGPVIVSRDPKTALGADDRAGACIVLTALLEIVRQRLPHPPLTLFWPVQEEIGLYGARLVNISKLGKPRLCFNFDSSGPEFAIVGATGDYNIQVEIEGIASHAGVHPEHGVSAIAIASHAIADLDANGWHGLVIKGKNTGTSNVGFIQAGEATNVVTPQLALRAEVRSHDPKFRRRLLDEFRKAFERAARRVKNDSGQCGRVRFESELKYESFRLADDEPCVATALAAIRAVGLDARTRIANGGLDANWMTAHGLPTVTIGCGQRNPHTVDECLDVADYLQACRIGLLLACGAV
jgi:tripeptide aminopeptidase